MIRLKEFTGEGKYTYDHFVGMIEAQRIYMQWGSRETAQIVRMNLGGEAQIAIEELEVVPTRWAELKAALRQRFQPEGHECRYRTEVLSGKRKPDETLAQFVTELRRLGRLAFPELSLKGREDILRDIFLRGQGSATFREQTLIQELGTLTQVLQLAERHESGMQELTGGKPSKA